MTDIFVTRHAGAVAWAQAQGITARVVAHLDLADIRPGDTVMGTLPIPMVAALCAKGARYLHLALDIPEEMRGRDLSADDMQRLGAELIEFEARKV